ncbi:MAG: hypothetical protein WCQ16_07495 [Verrucomicrobiae bacterium]
MPFVQNVKPLLSTAAFTSSTLSLEILDGHFGDGDKIQAGIEKGKLVFSKS